MHETHRVIDHLVDLTALRDSELLDFSLLKTIAETTASSESILVKVDSRDRPRYSIRYRRCDGGPDIANGELTLPEEQMEAIRLVHRQHTPAQLRQQDGRSLCVLPVNEDRILSTYLLLISERPASRAELRVARGLARIYSNYLELLDESQRDQLTGLMNRRTFEEGIGRILLQPARTGGEGLAPDRRRPLEAGCYWFGMIDIDRFKTINDTYGHLYGDEVLLLLAQLMRRTFRESDLLFRFGGEEFVAVTCNADRASARLAFERFRCTVAECEFPQVGRVTVSVGVTEVTPHTATTTLIDRADAALYYAKNHGRNQVVFHEEMVERGEARGEPERVGSIDLF